MDSMAKVITNILVLRQQLPCAIPPLRKAVEALPMSQAVSENDSESEFRKPLRLTQRRVLNAYQGLTAALPALQSLCSQEGPPRLVCLMLGPFQRPREVYVFRNVAGLLPPQAVLDCHERLMNGGAEWVHTASTLCLSVSFCVVIDSKQSEHMRLTPNQEEWILMHAPPRFSKTTKVLQLFPLHGEEAEASDDTEQRADLVAPEMQWYCCVHAFKGTNVLR